MASPIAFGARNFWRDTNGASAVLIGLSMTVLMGFAGLAVDAGVWYADKRNAQGAADAAAYSAAIDAAAGDTTTGVITTAKAITARYGMTDATNGVTVTVNTPPASGPNTSNSKAVEVVVAKAERLFLSGLFTTAPTVKARAVSVAGSSGGLYCVMTLDTAAGTTTTTTATNGATIDLTACGVQVNGPGSNALSVNGGATIRATTVSVVGGISLSNGGSIVVSGAKTTAASPVANPYANVAVPAVGACNYNNANYSSGGQQYTISPGVYCNGLNVSNGVSVTMNPGVYIINGGVLGLLSGTITATSGVTFVLTGSGSSYATANIANGVTLNLTAPTAGATAGLAIFQDPAAPTSGQDTVEGGATMNVKGALYFPHQTVNFSNGTSNNSVCTQLIAYDLVFTGGAKFGNTCGGAGVTGIGAAATSLVE